MDEADWRCLKCCQCWQFYPESQKLAGKSEGPRARVKSHALTLTENDVLGQEKFVSQLSAYLLILLERIGFSLLLLLLGHIQVNFDCLVLGRALSVFVTLTGARLPPSWIFCLMRNILATGGGFLIIILVIFYKQQNYQTLQKHLLFVLACKSLHSKLLQTPC